MKQYTERELDKKIRAFITSKTDQFPELACIKGNAIDKTNVSRDKINVLQDLFTSKLKPSFK